MKLPTLALAALSACGPAIDPDFDAVEAGEQAQDFTLIDGSGQLVSLSDTDGVPRLILGTAGW